MYKNQSKRKIKNLQLCIEAIYDMYSAFGLPVISIALVEGNAYGGGFECTLAHDFIIVDEDVKFGLPENKFNLFPGMGAHSLLIRKINVVEADVLIRSRKTYTARYLESLGLVDEVVEKDKSLLALYKFVDKLKEQFNFEYHHIQCKKAVNPLTKEELLKITNVWVDACMKVSLFDLRKMEILANAQSRKAKGIPIRV
ncbi:crotonase/enoyl-CoA hydratase family protein [Flavivirga aquatica]|uniref:crotonase/enoyl-CoA hydratase family protein n=1 Tax=Flavivirga aquatica TaxID=1849968 RepID=UPI001F0B16B2|nr:crotonase/enoyl-CoA hydratase family protein [Flavivirga aquatica]